MERKKFWATIGISSGWSLTIFGAIVLFNHWAPPLGWCLFGVGVFLWIMAYCLALQWDRSQPRDKSKGSNERRVGMQNKDKKKWTPYAVALFAGGTVLLAQGFAEWFSVYWHWDYARSVTIFIFAVVILLVAWFNRHENPSGDKQ